jgi:putative multiple sugar transport system permease protein
MSATTTSLPAQPSVEPPEDKPSLVQQVRASMGGNVRQYGMIFALLALILLFQVLTDGLFLEPRNVTSLLVQNGYILILAIGMVMVIIAGHIDLSVGSVAAFVGATVALVMQRYDLPWPAAIVLGLVVGLLVGAWQGYWVAYVGIPAFIVTLAGMLLFRGLDLIMLDASSIAVPEGFQTIANGFIPEMGPDTGYHNPTLVIAVVLVVLMMVLELRRRAALARYGMDVPPMALSVLKLVVLGGALLVVALLLASYRGVPVVGLILAALVALYTFIMNKTVFGRHIYSVGGNAGAARLSGVDTRRVDFMVMMNMGLLAGVAGMVFTAYLNAANPKDGTGFELDAIAAVFIGGAAVAGGIGTVLGSMIGGLVMGVLNLGLANLSVDSNFVQIIKGLVLLLAVAFDVRSKIQGRPSFIGMLIKGVNRGGGGGGTVVIPDAPTLEVDGATTNRAGTPSGTATGLADVPHGVDTAGGTRSATDERPPTS